MAPILTGIPDEIYDEEVVCFLADRHHTTPRNIIQCFSESEQNGGKSKATSPAFCLEENEMTILRDMMAEYL